MVTPPPIEPPPPPVVAADAPAVDAAVVVASPEVDGGARPAVRPVTAGPVDHYRSALAAYNAGNYRLAQVEAERAVEARQGGANGLNARVLFGRALIGIGNQHRRAWEALCVVVNQAPHGADARNKACRYLVASAGCQSAAHTACCAACGQ